MEILVRIFKIALGVGVCILGLFFIGLGLVMGVKSPGTDIVFYLFGGIIVLSGSVILSTIIYQSASNVAKDIKNMEESKMTANMQTEPVVIKASYIEPDTNCIHRGDE